MLAKLNVDEIGEDKSDSTPSSRDDEVDTSLAKAAFLSKTTFASWLIAFAIVIPPSFTDDVDDFSSMSMLLLGAVVVDVGVNDACVIAIDLLVVYICCCGCCFKITCFRRKVLKSYNNKIDKP